VVLSRNPLLMLRNPLLMARNPISRNPTSRNRLPTSRNPLRRRPSHQVWQRDLLRDESIRLRQLRQATLGNLLESLIRGYVPTDLVGLFVEWHTLNDRAEH
jgi:hypothetical protein